MRRTGEAPTNMSGARSVSYGVKSPAVIVVDRRHLLNFP